LRARRSNASEDILDLARGRDQEAFVRLFLQFAPKVKSYLIRQGLRPEVAEELAQETLVIVWRKADTFDPARAGAAAWIFTIARNLRIDALRRERHPSDIAAMDGQALWTEPSTPEEVYADEEREKRVRRALEHLSPDQLEVLRMSFFEGRPHSDIAAGLGLPLGTVKSRLRLAVARLRMLLVGNLE
jgi:RNA polymerase sigma-70 factor (ECF subfamily)